MAKTIKHERGVNLKRFFVFVRNQKGIGWTTNSFDTSKEAEHFAGLFKAEGREAYIKEMY